MAALTDAQRTFIVQQLAFFRTPSEVVEDVKDAFGIELSRQQVQYYHPERLGSGPPAEKWIAVFEHARARYLEEISAVPVAHQRYRLDVLQRMLRVAEGAHGAHTNPKLVLEILEQAAKEVGGAFTNHQVLDHRGKIETGVLVVPASGSGWEEEPGKPGSRRNRVSDLDTDPSENGGSGRRFPAS